jgi:hypothetical protein
MQKEVMKDEVLKKKRSNPITFADYFKIDENKLKELGVFNPILNFDTKFFVEPLLLKTSSSEIVKQSYANYHNFFIVVLKALRRSDKKNDMPWNIAKGRLNFPEYKDTCIGYGGDSINGSGSGKGLNDKILNRMKEIADISDEPDILPYTSLLENGIGGDRISDMVQTIIDEDICKYTVDVMGKIGLTGDFKYVAESGVVYFLPTNIYSHCPVKLLPKDILSDLPIADNFEDWVLNVSQVNENLRKRVNKDLGEAWKDLTKEERKKSLLEKIKTDRDFFLEVVRAVKEASLGHYDIDEDSKGLYKWLKDSKYLIKLSTLNVNQNFEETPEAFALEVKRMIIHFQNLIEESANGLFWGKSGEKLVHAHEFYSQMVFNMVCEYFLSLVSSKIEITRIIDEKSKEVVSEFAFKNFKIFVYLKHSDNKSLENSYKSKLQFLEEAFGMKGFFVVLNFSEKEANQIKEIKSKEKPLCEIVQIEGMITKEIPAIQVEGNIEGKYTEEKRKGGVKRHQNTNLIKENIIKKVFEIKMKASKTQKVSVISSKIINELHTLKTEKACKDFANKYSISNVEDVNLAFQYITKHIDGGQISEWCYKFNKIPSTS